jgi:hypothetical protein
LIRSSQNTTTQAATLLATLQAVLFVFVVASMLQLVLGPVRRNPAAFFRSVLTMIILCGGITYCWVRCARRSLLWAALGGFLGGFLISYAVTLLDYCFVPGEHRFPDNRFFDTLVSWRFHLQVGLNALAWGSWGLMGALAINRKWGPCPSMGVLAGTLALDPVWMILMWAWFGPALLQRATLALLFLGTFRTAGWVLGLYMCPVADQTLDLSPVVRSRRGLAVFWGMILGAVVLYGVVIVAILAVSHPAK